MHKGTRLFLCKKMDQERSEKGKGVVRGGREKGGGEEVKGRGEILA